MTNLIDLKKAIKSLSPSEKRELLEALEHDSQSSMVEVEEQRFSEGIYCPHCGSVEQFQKFGFRNGVQRYRCKDCGRIFTATSDSILSGTHKELSVWEQYIQCLLDGLSIRKTAEICGISVRTSFTWRHKILDALSSRSEREITVKGVIEADETFFRVSFKGSRNLPEGRKPHHRGEKASMRGLSKEQVCVPCAMDRNNSVLSKVCNLGKINTKQITAFYEGKVLSGAIFVTDSEKSYKPFATAKEYKLIQIERGKHKNGIYHINHINAYHNNLKNFMDKFRGVATKYLNNYLVWNNSIKMGVSEVLSAIVKEFYITTCSEISSRDAIPLMTA